MVETKLAQGLEAVGDDETLIAATAFILPWTEWRARSIGVRTRSNQDPLNFPIKVDGRLAQSAVYVGAGELGYPVSVDA